jgi:hypothetical protein
MEHFQQVSFYSRTYFISSLQNCETHTASIAYHKIKNAYNNSIP